MFSLQKKSSVLVVTAGLTLGLAACGSNDQTVGSGTGSSTAPSVAAPSSAAPSSAAPSSAAPSASPSPVAALDSLTGKQTAVTLDKDFLAALTSLKVKPAPIAPATLVGAKIAFPITGGNVTYFEPDSGVTPFVQGLINHDGSGLSLTGAGKVVKLEDFEVDPAKSMLFGKVTVDGKVAFERAPLFDLDGSTVKPLAVDAASNTAVLEGAGVSLTKEAAGALNMVFGITDLKEGLQVGVAEITLALPKS